MITALTFKRNRNPQSLCQRPRPDASRDNGGVASDGLTTRAHTGNAAVLAGDVLDIGADDPAAAGLDMGGQIRFGPDIEWVDEIDYEVDPSRGDSFYEAVRSYWPDLPDGALEPGYSGIRPKIAKPGGAGLDFMIQGPEETGVDGFVNLFGIESPGLTSSLAIGKRVLSLLEG